MGRVDTSLGKVRKVRGIPASDLARRAHVSRQTIYAIEAGTYVPNTEVALRLARELEVGVEDLFALPEEASASGTRVTADYLGRQPPAIGQAARACQIGSRWVTIPVDARPHHLPHADAVITSAARGSKAKIELFSDRANMRNQIVLAGCDPASGLLAHMVGEISGVDVVHAPASSRLALEWLKQGKVHIAGSHLEDPKSSEFNLPFVRRRFAGRDIAVVTFASWEEGFVVLPGNPKRIRTVEDLGRKDIAVVNREPGSGSRSLLDSLIRSSGMKAKAIRGYARIAFGHVSAAYSVLAGEADCCVATRSAAQTFGLDFVPLRTERYDFVFGRESLQLAGVEAFLDVLQRAALRRRLEALAGYDTSETGVVRA